MGDAFLRAYYSVHDLDLRKFGLVGKALTTTSNSVFSKLSTDALENIEMGLIVTFCVLVVILLFFSFHRCLMINVMKKRNKRIDL